MYFERHDHSFEYHKDPVKTAASRHPRHEAWATTGDAGYLDEDGYLFLTGRNSFTIISGGGVNIYPQETEAVLSLHPRGMGRRGRGGVPDPDLGERVEAFVHPVDGVEAGDALEQEIIEYCGIVCRASNARGRCTSSTHCRGRRRARSSRVRCGRWWRPTPSVRTGDDALAASAAVRGGRTKGVRPQRIRFVVHPHHRPGGRREPVRAVLPLQEQTGPAVRDPHGRGSRSTTRCGRRRWTPSATTRSSSCAPSSSRTSNSARSSPNRAG